MLLVALALVPQFQDAPVVVEYAQAVRLEVLDRQDELLGPAGARGRHGRHEPQPSHERVRVPSTQPELADVLLQPGPAESDQRLRLQAPASVHVHSVVRDDELDRTRVRREGDAKARDLALQLLERHPGTRDTQELGPQRSDLPVGLKEVHDIRPVPPRDTVRRAHGPQGTDDGPPLLLETRERDETRLDEGVRKRVDRDPPGLARDRAQDLEAR